MKKIIYSCDSCGKEETHPMALFMSGSSLEWRMSSSPDSAYKHACSKDCALKLAAAIPQPRLADPESISEGRRND